MAMYLAMGEAVQPAPPAPVYSNYNCTCSQSLNAVNSAGASLGYLRNTGITFQIRNGRATSVSGHNGENCWAEADGKIDGYIRVTNVSATATKNNRSSDVTVVYVDDEGQHTEEFNYEGLIAFYTNTMKMCEEEAISTATALYDFSDLKNSPS